MTTMTDAEIIAWARDWADELASARQFSQEARYRRLADLAEKGGWQPIATAPLDGSDVLFVSHGDVYQGRWDKRENMWRSDRGLLLGVATHWQPLPAPPGGGR